MNFRETSSIALAISSSVENFDIPNRRAESIAGLPDRIAVNTWLGGLLPLLHADPLLQATPAMSRPSSISCRSAPMNERQEVDGNRPFDFKP